MFKVISLASLSYLLILIENIVRKCCIIINICEFMNLWSFSLHPKQWRVTVHLNCLEVHFSNNCTFFNFMYLTFLDLIAFICLFIYLFDLSTQNFSVLHRLSRNSVDPGWHWTQRSSCLWVLSVGIKDLCHHHPS